MVNLEYVGDYRQPQLTARQRELGFDGQSDGEFSFDDFLDIINPLQHIPIISTLYREITGDQISAPARILGGALFGGPTGFLSAAVNSIYEEINGEDIGETALALFTGDSDAEPQFAEGEEGGVPINPSAGLDALIGPTLTTAAGAPAASSADAATRAAAQIPLPTPAPAAVAPQPAIASQEMAPAGGDNPGMLTGQDALSALFRDLGGGATPVPPPAAPAAAPRPLPLRQDQAMKSIPLPPRPLRAAPAAPPPAAPSSGGEAAAAHPLIFAQQAPEDAVAGRMMEALDKYRAMSQQRQDAPKKEAVQWRTDPALTDSGS